MQTFLPYPSFTASAAVLDRQRLGKQRVETLQLLQCLAGEKTGWRNHPATRMWQGHEHHLAHYGAIICLTWLDLGYKDTCLRQIVELGARFDATAPHPFWLGNPDFHRAHRSNLVRKKPEHYRPLFEADLPDDLPYIWPAERTPA